MCVTSVDPYWLGKSFSVPVESDADLQRNLEVFSSRSRRRTSTPLREREPTVISVNALSSRLRWRDNEMSKLFGL